MAMQGAVLKHRNDIDGLRALAVLPVVAFHLGIHKLTGGFVGVDVFFVISGYLIGSIIVNEVDQGRFSFVRFYERRVRRIFPALFVMLAVATAAFAVLLPPVMLADYARSLIAAVFSVSNVYFWTQESYFSESIKPLRHTWSLGIEEQFYILLPIAVVLLSRYGLTVRRWAIGAIAAISFLWSAIGAFTEPTSTFYLLHTRAWELLLGVFLPLGMFPVFRTALSRNIATAAGFGMIAATMLLLNKHHPFPGLTALPACLGTVLILRAGETGGSLVAWLLSLWPARFVGLISYSLYLWHLPIIALRWTTGLEVPGGSRVTELTMVAIMFVAATLSWRFVEQPIREGRTTWLPARPLFTGAGVAVAVTTVAGVALVALQGLPARFSPTDNRILTYLGREIGAVGRTGKCFIDDEPASAFSPAVCLKTSTTSRNYLLVGDSHAAAMWNGLASALPEVNLMQANTVGCRDIVVDALPVADRCKQMFGHVYQGLLTNGRVDKVLLVGRWWEGDLPELGRALDWAKAHNVRVVLVGPMVQYDGPLPWLLVRARGDGAEVARHQLREEKLDRQMRRLAEAKGAQYISLLDALCVEGGCTTLAGPGIPLQFDDLHLTPEGSVFLANRLRSRGDLP